MRPSDRREPTEPEEPGDIRFQDYNDELAEFDELNASTANSTFLDNPWFRRTGIAFAAVIAIAFLLPLLAPFFEEDRRRASSPPDSNLVVLPDFVLPSASGKNIRLSDETQRNEIVVLVFYRGYF